MSRAWLNLVLLLLLVGLVALVYFEPGLEKQQTSALTTLNPDQVSELRLERANAEPLLFQRLNGQWFLHAPVAVAANDFRLQQLLEVLTATSIQHYSAADLDLSKYGLERPQSRLIVDGLEIAFGQLDPLNYRRYVLLNDEMHLIPTTDMGLMGEAWPGFVSPQLITAAAQLKEIELPALGKIFHDPSGWHYQGDKQPASADAIQVLIDAWRNAAAIRIDSAETLPAEEGEIIRLVFVDDSQLLLRLLRQEGEVMLIRDDLGLAYQFGSSQAARLLQWPEAVAAESMPAN